MSVLCVIQARTGSTRLPGKVLADLGGRPMLRFMLDRLARLSVDDLVVATSDLHQDDPVAAIAGGAGVAVVRGPEDDVLARFALALVQHPADTVVRLTADCPLTDPALVDLAVSRLHALDADYMSNSLVRTFPDGLDVEVTTAVALRDAHAEAVDPVEREHVTPFIYRRTGRYAVGAFTVDDDLGRERWTVDTADDLERIRAMVARLDDPISATWRDVLGVAGRQVLPVPDQMWLRPTPTADAATRTWTAIRNGHIVADVAVHAIDGIGHLSFRGPDDERAQVVSLVESALRSDYQVVELRAESSP